MNYKKSLLMLGLVLFPLSAWSLPDWAEQALRGVDLNAAPEDAEAWQIYDETVVTYQGGGIFEKRRYQLRYASKDRGSTLASVIALASDGENAELERLTGWHRSALGKEEKLARSSVLTVNDSNASILENNRSTFAVFRNATKGSLIAFETVEKTESFYNLESIRILSLLPTHTRVIKIKGYAGLDVKLNGAEDWNLDQQQAGEVWTFKNLPGTLGEHYRSPFKDLEPSLLIIAKEGNESRLASWDGLAKWYYQLFTSKALAGEQAPQAQQASDLETLKQIMTQATQSLTYRQRYLAYDRGWEPLSGKEVKRFAYGDCKDMTAFVSYECAEQKISAFPALVTILDGYRSTEKGEVLPFFNHVIAAIPVEENVTAPAVVNVGDQHYLLADATSKYTPFGKLPAHYKNLEAMICTPEGASWIKVPDEALETEKANVKLMGMMDANLTFVGSMSIAEYGDSLGLRSAYLNGGSRNLLDAFAIALDIPGSTDLELSDVAFAEDQALSVRVQTRWPSFMRRDSGGLRLPYDIAPIGIGYLKDTVEDREMPLYLAPIADITYDLTIRSAVHLTPITKSKTIELANRKLTWEASGGPMLRVKIALSGKEAIFAKGELEKGINIWDEQRKALYDFWSVGTVFDIPAIKSGAP